MTIMQDTQAQQALFLITVGAQNNGDLDTTIMRSGIEQAIDIGRREGMLTALEDETTEIGAITVSNPPSPAEALILMLGDEIAATPDARQAVERAVAALVREFPRERIVVLTEEDRNHIISGMVATRQSWENSGDGWIADAVYNGYDGYGKTPDVQLLEAAFCDNPILAHLVDDADRLGVLRVLAKPEVLDIICSTEPAQPAEVFDAFACHVASAVGPMTGAGRTSRPADVLEALQLQGLILNRLAARLGIDDPDDEEASEAPRG